MTAAPPADEDPAAAALARLYAEELPTGSFGGGPPARRQPAPDPNAAAHRAELLAELAHPRRAPAAPARHLRAVPDTPPAA